MIEHFGGALLFEVNSFLVELEAAVSGVDGDGDGALGGDRDLEGFFIAFGKINEAGVICSDGGFLEVTFLLGSLVRV